MHRVEENQLVAISGPANRDNYILWVHVLCHLTLSDFKLQNIGHTVLVTNDLDKDGGLYRKIEEVGSFLEGLLHYS